jgi:hypothetical protein
MAYKTTVQTYSYNFQPPDAEKRPDVMALYLDGELRSMSRSVQSLASAVAEIQTGTASGKTVTLQPTGVKAGVYRNVTLTIGTDGRITAVESASSSTVFPMGGSSGQFLATDGNGGVFWKTLPAASSSGGVSSGGGGGGSSSVTVPKAIDSADLKATANASTFTFALKPTGITAGHYTNADLTVDAAGRVTSIASGVAVPPVFTTQTWQAADSSIWTVMMSNAGILTTTLSTAADSVTAQDGRTMISTEDGSDYIAF